MITIVDMAQELKLTSDLSMDDAYSNNGNSTWKNDFQIFEGKLRNMKVTREGKVKVKLFLPGGSLMELLRRIDEEQEIFRFSVKSKNFPNIKYTKLSED